MNSFFQLGKYGTNPVQEFFAGVTTFLAMSSILLINPSVAAEAGMPYGGAFAATALIAFATTLTMALYANAPLGMAPGIDINTLVVYTLCGELGFHWKEALAATFLSGLLYTAITCTRLRMAVIAGIPRYLKYASSVGVGMFIAYIGIKNAGLLVFIATPGAYSIGPTGMVVANSFATPALAVPLNTPHLIAFVSFFATAFLIILEKKTGERYYALPLGIAAATLVGIPLEVTSLEHLSLPGLSLFRELGDIAFSFFGDPGLLSLIQSPAKILTAVLATLLLAFTSLVDAVTTVVAISQLNESADRDENYQDFIGTPGLSSRLDRALLVSSTGGLFSALAGTTTSVVYIESVPGIVAGGRTGLASVVTAFLFLLCIPLSAFFNIVPSAAIAPALIVSGIYIFTLMGNIDWKNLEEALPASVVVMVIPFTCSLMNGIALGYLTHIVVQTARGKAREIHPFLWFVTAAFILLNVLRTWGNI